MNFLYPQLLFGLFALAIPIIVHLFNFRRTKKVYFSNTKFLKKVKEASSSKLKLKHYLILLSRILAIFFLVVAFAQPYWNTENAAPPSDQVIIYLDNSMSMSNEVDNGLSAFDEAVSYINSLLKVYPQTTSYKLITNDFSPFSNSFKSVSEIEEELTSLSVSGTPRNLQAIAQRFNSVSNRDSVDVYWISDFQKSSAGEAINFESDYFNLNLIPLRYTSESNVFIDSIYVDNPFLIGSKQLKLNVKLTNTGENAVNDLGIKVFLDSIQSATTTTNLPALGSEILSFDLAYDVNRLSRGRVSVEEYPVTFDNDFYFVFNSTKRINILEVTGEGTADYVSKVFGNEQLFQFNTFNAGNLDYSLLKYVDLVVVNGLVEISSSLAIALNERLKSNKRVLIIPPASLDINTYKLINTNLELSSVTEKLKLATPDFRDPFFENVFEEQSNRFAMAQSQPVLNLGIDRTATLRFENSSPFLREMNGAYIFSSPLSDEYSTFQNHALFVPVMYKIAAQSVSTTGRLYHTIDNNRIVVEADSLISDNVYKLVNSEVELIPSQRRVSGDLMIEIPRYLLKPGFYDLRLVDETINTLAFNTSSDESKLAQMTTEELSDMIKGNTTIMNTEEVLIFEDELKNKYSGTPLWKYAIVLVLLFLLMEVLLIRFFP